MLKGHSRVQNVEILDQYERHIKKLEGLGIAKRVIESEKDFDKYLEKPLQILIAQKKKKKYPSSLTRIMKNI